MAARLAEGSHESFISSQVTKHSTSARLLSSAWISLEPVLKIGDVGIEIGEHTFAREEYHVGCSRM